MSKADYQEIISEYKGNFWIPRREKLLHDACFEKDEDSVRPEKEHLLTM